MYRLRVLNASNSRFFNLYLNLAARPTDIPAIKLNLAAAASSVNVTAGLETVQTTSPAISTTMTAEQIERLPVGDRNPLEFISTLAEALSVITVPEESTRSTLFIVLLRVMTLEK